MLRYLEAIAPSTAASRSASSNTMNGALPPSSSETFFTVDAHCAISSLPTSVEPVNENLRTSGFCVSSRPTFGRLLRRHDVEHAFGNAGAMRKFGQRQRRKRRFAGGLDDEGAARGQRRRAFARDHRVGKIPRRDRGDDADGFLDHDDAAARLVGGDHVAIDALSFFREPFDEGCAVGDFAARFGQRLSLFGRHDLREVFLVRHDQVEPFAHEDAAFLRRLRAPGGKRCMRRPRWPRACRPRRDRRPRR